MLNVQRDVAILKDELRAIKRMRERPVPRQAKQFPPLGTKVRTRSVWRTKALEAPDGIIGPLTRRFSENIHERNVVEVMSSKPEGTDRRRAVNCC
jgi:hypothetical protein